MQEAICNNVLELTFTSGREYGNPLWDVELSVEVVAPDGRRLTYDGFWDGGVDWRVRIGPDQPGRWDWKTTCSDPDNSGLHGRQGSFNCAPYTGDNPLYRHGPLRVSDDSRHLMHADGTPFFWLADTAWNGVIRGDDDNWAGYLDQRVSQRFSAIQFVLPQWRGDEVDESGRPGFTDTPPIKVLPEYFQEKDRRVAMVNERGLLAAPVLLWSLLETDIGYKLPEADAIRMARYMVARYGAYQVAWLLGGDGDYHKMGIARWKHIGRAVFGGRHDRPVTLHPCGVAWPNEAFRSEQWLDFLGYQSGHGDGEADLRWLTQGPPATQWDNLPAKPVINLEPNYETAHGYQHQTQFDDRLVRRACYWSCLIAPTAGVTYGDDRIWNWNLQPGPSEGHGDWGGGRIEPWHAALDTPGQQSMKVLRDIFESLAWHHLRPAQHLLTAQPGRDDAGRFIAAAATEEGDVALIYAPVGGDLPVDRTGFVESWWINPRSGERSRAENTTTPDGQDWLLLLTR